MGALTNLIDFVDGGKKPSGATANKAIISIRLLISNLNRQIKQLEIKATQAKKKAKLLREKGNIPGSKIQIKGYLQFQKFANSLEGFRMNMEGLQFKLEQAKAMNDFSGCVRDVAGSLSVIKNQIKTPELTQLMTGLNINLEEINVAQEIMTDSMEDISEIGDSEVTDVEVEHALSEIDAEIMVSSGGQLANASYNDVEEMEKKIEELKKRS